MDIVKILENICTDLGYKFNYGNKSHLNLIDPNYDFDSNNIHFLMFPPTRNLANNSDSSRTYSGNFAFVIPDEFAQDYYKNTNSNETNNKYDNKILPCIIEMNKLEDRLAYCENMDLIQLSSMDLVDFINANLSGLWVTYQFKVYE